MSSTTILEFSSEEILVIPDDAARLYGGAGYKMDPQTRSETEILIERTFHSLSPAAIYRRFAVRSILPEGLLLEGGTMLHVPAAEQNPTAEYLIAGVCTLGGGFDGFYRRTAETGDLCRSMLVDAVGVAFLEKLALCCMDIFRRRAGSLGLFAGCYFGPGYGDCPMESQQKLFSLVDPSPIGVKLMSSLAMNPFKSLSFFLFYSRKENRRNRLSKCQRCSLENCRFRHSPTTESGSRKQQEDIHEVCSDQ